MGWLLPAAAACHGDSTSPAPPLTTPLADADIARAIERHFLDEGLLRLEHLHIAVSQGVATLSGSIGDLRAKQRALLITETIRGVRSVIDEISVTPVPRTDAQLQSDVTRALARDSATRPYTISVAAKDGTVTFSGTADSWQAKTAQDGVGGASGCKRSDWSSAAPSGWSGAGSTWAARPHAPATTEPTSSVKQLVKRNARAA